jgi:hypothetical protein
VSQQPAPVGAREAVQVAAIDEPFVRWPVRGGDRKVAGHAVALGVGCVAVNFDQLGANRVQGRLHAVEDGFYPLQELADLAPHAVALVDRVLGVARGQQLEIEPVEAAGDRRYDVTHGLLVDEVLECYVWHCLISLSSKIAQGTRSSVSYDLAAQLRPALNQFGVYTFQGRVVKPRGQSGRRLVNHMLQQMQHAILLHELGHGYSLTWPIPTTSNDEAIADLFAGWAAVKVLNDPGALLALADYRELIASFIKTFPALATWNRQQGYEDLFRLYHSNPGKYRAIARLIPNGAAGPGGASFGDFSPGPWSGIEDALQPIALVPLR